MKERYSIRIDVELKERLAVLKRRWNLKSYNEVILRLTAPPEQRS